MSDRQALIRIASGMPEGDPARRAILSSLKEGAPVLVDAGDEDAVRAMAAQVLAVARKFGGTGVSVSGRGSVIKMDVWVGGASTVMHFSSSKMNIKIMAGYWSNYEGGHVGDLAVFAEALKTTSKFAVLAHMKFYGVRTLRGTKAAWSDLYVR